MFETDMVFVELVESSKAPFVSFSPATGDEFDGQIFLVGLDDTDGLYEELAENLEVDEKDLIEFQDLADDDVQTLLDDAKKHGFIRNYELYEMRKVK